MYQVMWCIKSPNNRLKEVQKFTVTQHLRCNFERQRRGHKEKKTGSKRQSVVNGISNVVGISDIVMDRGSLASYLLT